MSRPIPRAGWMASALSHAPRFRLFSTTPIAGVQRPRKAFGLAHRALDVHPQDPTAASSSTPPRFRPRDDSTTKSWKSTRLQSQQHHQRPTPPMSKGRSTPTSRTPIDARTRRVPRASQNAPDADSTHSPNAGTTGHVDSQPVETADKRTRWRPAKKLTYQAMAGLRALHANDPETFSKDALSERFGISYEAVTRILRSKYQDKKGGDAGESIQGTKWDLDAGTSSSSPAPIVKRAFAGRNGSTKP